MQNGIRWVATRPLVENPQTAKVVNNSQKSTDLAPRISPAIAIMNGLPERGGSSTISFDPNGPSPIAAGLSGSISSTTGISARITPATTSGTMCQPWETTRLASNGRKTNCPEALLGGQQPDHQPSPMHEPAIGDRGRQPDHAGAGPKPDQHAPGEIQLPDLADERA